MLYILHVFYSSRAQTDQRHPVDHGTSYTAVVPRAVADLYPQTNEDTPSKYSRSEYHIHTACKDEFI